MSKLAKKILSGGSKVLDALAVPQNYAMRKAAQAAGLPGAENSEQSAQQLVEAAANKLGIPESSTAGNVAKALGVAGLEVFGDPLGALGKSKKLANIVQKAAKSSDLKKLQTFIRKSEKGANVDLEAKRALMVDRPSPQEVAQAVKSSPSPELSNRLGDNPINMRITSDPVKTGAAKVAASDEVVVPANTTDEKIRQLSNIFKKPVRRVAGVTNE